MGPEDQTVCADEPDVEQAAVEIRFPDTVGEDAEREERKLYKERSILQIFSVLLVGSSGEV